jgi:hypothetical protein
MTSLRAFSFEDDVTESLLLFHALYDVEETVLLHLQYTVLDTITIIGKMKYK